MYCFPLPTPRAREYVLNKMWPEMKELITKYEPHVLWADGDWDTYPPYWGTKEFLAWLYNESPTREQIVTNDRWGIGCFKTHGDFYSGPDRFDPGTLQAHKWENAMSIDPSWGYRRNINREDLMSMHGLVTKVRKKFFYFRGYRRAPHKNYAELFYVGT